MLLDDVNRVRLRIMFSRKQLDISVTGMWVLFFCECVFCAQSHTTWKTETVVRHGARSHITDFSHRVLSVLQWYRWMAGGKNQHTRRASALRLPGSLDLIKGLHTSRAKTQATGTGAFEWTCCKIHCVRFWCKNLSALENYHGINWSMRSCQQATTAHLLVAVNQ